MHISIQLYGYYCDEKDYTYAYHATDTIYICDLYINAEDSGYNSKMGTMVHELTHAVSYTKDWVYEESNCLYEAKYYSSYAIQNADNYRYFTQQLEQEQ